MNNLEIAKIFRDIANILEIKGENVFRIRAYERAGQNIEVLPEDVSEYAKAGRLREIPGIGADLEGKINEFLSSGKIQFYLELKKTVPSGVLDLLDIPGIGPKTAGLLYNKLRIKNISALAGAIEAGKLKNIPGIKEKSIENILKGIEIVKKAKERISLAEAMILADEFILPLSRLTAVKKVTACGSLRRKKDNIGDIDILVSSREAEKVIKVFTEISEVKQIISQGKTKSSVRLKNGRQVDCRVVEDKSFGAALLYFTGSKNFNIKIRMLAQKKGFKINEYGIFKNDKYLAGKTEEELFKYLGLAYIEPELREDNGEIELAKNNKLPDLVELSDIKGDLHAHSLWSDGGNSIKEMAQACVKLGYSYAAITDHSQSLKVANGLSASELKEKKREIDKINSSLKNFRILFGTEVDIDSNGRLDYSEEILKEFDIVVAAVHSGFKQPKAQLTRRIISACKNKYVNIISHPTGRLWGVREAYELDFNEIFKAAAETNTALEINSFANRLDLNDLNCRRAKLAGVKFSVDSDAHTTGQLESMHLGISVARRGWLSKNEIINTLDLDKLLKAIKK